MNDDSNLSTGAVETFGNESPPDETKKALEEEKRRVQELLPTAEKELERINEELLRANDFTDFTRSLGDVPTNIPEIDIRAKLEARQMYIAMLLSRKTSILNDLEEAEVEVAPGIADDPDPSMPTPETGHPSARRQPLLRRARERITHFIFWGAK